jgi:heptosyltransferase II
VFCRPCMLRECPIDHRCMKRIQVDDVAQSVARHLGIS